MNTKQVEMQTATPALYGISHSNRNFADPFYWGKNQFNSSFPAALCCYMRDKGQSAVYISLEKKKTKISESSFSKVFGSVKPNGELIFDFEETYEPYKKFVHDALEHIDLVIRDAETGKYLRPLEIKLTTLPDDGTSSLAEEDYGSELVVRSPTMRYLALGVAEAVSPSDAEVIRDIFEPHCKGIGKDWESMRAMLSYRDELFDAVEQFLEKFQHLQKPLLIQPIWKTLGKSPILADNCLDVFVWSDFALARMVLDTCYHSGKDAEKKIPRHQRAILRLARFLYEFSVSGKVYQEPIYDGMTYGPLNDKEFSMSGAKTNPYMACERLLKPTITKGEIKKIVLGGGQKFLSPERRFDSILFFSKELFDE